MFMSYEHPPYCPPSEAGSVLFRLTRGCPWNQCTFCSMYKHTPFERRPVEEIVERGTSYNTPVKKKIRQ